MINIRNIYSGGKIEEIGKPNNFIGAIFLAGPNSSSELVTSCYNNSWRKEAHDILEVQLPFAKKIDNIYKNEGTIDLYIPEWESEDRFADIDSLSTKAREEYINEHRDWELRAINKANIILFWVPRNIINGPKALNTNTEFGYCIASCPKRVVFGYPYDADEMGYMDNLYYKKTGRISCSTLSHTVECALIRLAICKEYESATKYKPW